MKKKKYIILSVIVILISIITLIGATYAVLTATIQGNKKISLKAGLLKVDFEEGNAINLDNAEPMSDSKGLKTSPYTFTITNTGTIEAYYYVSLENDVNNTLNEDLVKMRLTNDQGYDSGVVRVSDYAQSSYQITEEGKLNVDDKVTYNLWLWLDNNADNTAQGKEYKSKIVVSSFDRSQNVKSVSDAVIENIGDNGSTYDDGTDTFITGTDPNNYIWYSGKLWRAVSINNEAKTTKLVTEWNISTVTYSSGSTAFEGSYMEDWLNDISIDGFLGNLREPEKFIVTDAKWDASTDNSELGSIQKPNGTTMVEDAVGLLNTYEYQSSYRGADYSTGYLNNGNYWWTLTPYKSSNIHTVYYFGSARSDTPTDTKGVRPSINLKSSVKIVDGDGTIDNPYRLNGDNDSNLSGTLLSTRYSGEYIRFGNDENNLYRIVSHENGTGTKITSTEPLKSSGKFIERALGSVNYSSTTTMGTFLNGAYLTSYVDSVYTDMIEDSTIWYFGTVEDGASYKLAKYTDLTGNTLTLSTTSAKVGLLRLGELMAGQFDRKDNNIWYWLLTPYSAPDVRCVSSTGSATDFNSSFVRGVRPSMNLKSNVVITSGDGTKNNPFTIELSS